jgi:molybdate transport system substrate-binding protein
MRKDQTRRNLFELKDVCTWKHVRMILAVTLIIFSGCDARNPRNGENPPSEIVVAAASDLTPAFEELGEKFAQTTGTKVVFSFGSTGMLAKQIENGAPMDLFAAANISFIDALEKKGLTVPETKAVYARGRITIWTNSDSKLGIEKLDDLARPEVKRIALANPDHAPYGLAAREALQSIGIWETVKPKCVFGENVRQTLQYAETGNVDVAIVALSLSMQSKGRWVLIAEELHKPLDQALTVIKGTKHESEARKFAGFINSEQGRPVMRKYGFILPSESLLR